MPSWPALHRALSTLLLVGATQVLPLEANEPIPAPGTLMELQDVQYSALSDWNSQYQAQCLKELGRQAGAFSALTPGAVFLGLIQANVTRLVPSMGLQYASVDSHGHPRRYSGRLFLPHHAAGSPPMRLPLVIYQHGTELRRSFTPYRNGGDETMLGALGAQAAGLAVAMPDGDGMGMDPSPERHAYCQAQTTARCLLDMVRAITSNQERIFDGINYVWDGRLFLLGYSEGGYIALAAVKALTTDPDWQDLWLTGAACMGGPFNLPVMMRTLLQDRSHTYTRPYLPAYFLATWEGLYPGVFTFQDAMNPLLLAPEPSRPGNPDQGSIQAWVAGVLGGKTITPRIQARLTGDPMQEVAAREVLNESWARTHVDPPETVLNQLLEANSLVGGWGPKVPVLLAHDPLDRGLTAALQVRDAEIAHSKRRNAFKREGLDAQLLKLAVQPAQSRQVAAHLLGAVVAQHIQVRPGIGKEIIQPALFFPTPYIVQDPLKEAGVVQVHGYDSVNAVPTAPGEGVHAAHAPLGVFLQNGGARR